MKLGKRIALAMAVMFAALLCFIAVTILYIRANHGPLPGWIFFLLPVFILCAFVVALVIVRKGRSRETAQPAAGLASQSSWMRTAIKAGFAIYVLGLLNGVRLVLEGAIPFKYALVGFTVCVALILAHWKALKRLDEIKHIATTPGARPK